MCSQTAVWDMRARAVPDGAADLVADLYRRMPDARITDILLEVDDATRFTEAFTHLRTGSPCRDRIGLLNVLLAEGINLGLRKMAEATTTHGFWELMRIARWHVEGEAYDRALSTGRRGPGRATGHHGQSGTRRRALSSTSVSVPIYGSHQLLVHSPWLRRINQRD